MRAAVKRRKVTPKKSSRESLVLALSDFHIGACTAVVLERLSTVVAMVADAASGRNIDECVVLLVGDIIDGEGIYPGQDISLEQHVAEQVKLAAKETWKVLLGLRELFPAVRVSAVRGNHGRSGHSPEANWDHMVYQQLDHMVYQQLSILADIDGSVGFETEYGDYGLTTIKGTRGLIRHKAPVQTDTAAARAKFGGWLAIHAYDWLLYGHCHHYGIMSFAGRPIFRNGCLPGSNDYSERLAVTDKPCQLLWGITPSRCPTFVAPLVWDG
jgi:hypothetical protein